MKICTILGARPQFIKAAVVSSAFRRRQEQRTVREVLVHTGQHYDADMSQVFFDELEIPTPHYHLGVGSARHGEQVAKMLMGVEEILIKEKPDGVLVYGDTNSTLAGTLAASKLHIPVAHVEAGLRSFNRNMPEEVNRIVVDHLSSLLFAPTKTAVDNCRKEGITGEVYFVPDVMEESVETHLASALEKSKILDSLGLAGKTYVLVTIHRAENTNSSMPLMEIFRALAKISEQTPVVVPLHPRTKSTLESTTDPQLNFFCSKIKFIDPVSYKDMLMLEAHALAILTDSGGVQKEAAWLGVPCITVRNETEWVETVQDGGNAVTGADCEKILLAFQNIFCSQKSGQKKSPTVHRKISAGTKIVEVLSSQWGMHT